MPWDVVTVFILQLHYCGRRGMRNVFWKVCSLPANGQTEFNARRPDAGTIYVGWLSRRKAVDGTSFEAADPEDPRESQIESTVRVTRKTLSYDAHLSYIDAHTDAFIARLAEAVAIPPISCDPAFRKKRAADERLARVEPEDGPRLRQISESDAVGRTKGRTQDKNDTSNEKSIRTLTTCSPGETHQDIPGTRRRVKGQ
ncbi:hypothetical protein FB451DRAFT_1180602 [Mycena latifolia]|nr:hypothetical protein FB451DRAFT_1180602 [Mycena latifolia]